MRAFRFALLLPLAALALAVGGCSEGFEDPCVVDPASCGPDGPETIGGVNVVRLLRPPSITDLNAARALWGEGAPQGYVGRLAQTETLSDGSTVYLVEGRDARSDTVATLALVRVPPLPVTRPPSYPVVLIAPEDDGVTTGDFLTRAADEPLASDWVQAVAVPRGGSVSLGGLTLNSPAAPSPYAMDVDDLIGVLSAVRGVVPRARGRAVAYGRGKGGTVALLASIRAPEIAAVVSLAAPSDFFLDPVRDAVRRVLAGADPVDALPGLAAVNEAAIVPLRDGEITIDEARVELLARSPAYFLETIAPTVAFHGFEDGVVPVRHGRRLETALRGITGLAGSYVETEDSHPSLFTNFGVRNEAATHLDQASR